MTKFSRYSFSELTFPRVASALRTRLAEGTHSIAWHFSPFAATNRERIERYKGIHTGKRCFVVANGPSLAKTKLEFLANEYTFGLNRVYLNFATSSFRPTYFVAVNELILEQFAGDIAKLEMPKFLNWNRRSYFDPAISKICYLKSKMVVNDSFESDLTKPIVVGGTVTFVTLQLAFYMGFDTVVLVGLDHRYVEKGIPSETVVRNENQDESHFHPNYFPKGVKWQLPDLRRSEIDFELARKKFAQDGRKILDATIDGNCQIFEKVDYLSLFQ